MRLARAIVKMEHVGVARCREGTFNGAMRKTLRYLAFFFIGDALLAGLAVLAVFAATHVFFLIDAVWTTAFNPAYAPYGVRASWTLYQIKIGDAGVDNIPGSLLLLLVLPGLFGAFFMARESLRQPGWRFWRWQ